MKKVLAMVLALIMALSLSAVAFAATGSTVDEVVNKDTNLKIDLGVGEGVAAGTTIVPDKPGATYMFALLEKNTATDAGTGDDPAYIPVTDDEYVQHLTVSIKESGDKMIKAYSIVKKDGIWYVKVTTEVSYDTAKKVADWTISLKRKALTVTTATVSEVTQKWGTIDGNGSVEGTDVSDPEALVNVDMATNELGTLYVAKVTGDKNSDVLLTMAKTNKVTEITFGGEDSAIWYTAQNSMKTTVNLFWDDEDETFSKFFSEADVYAMLFKGKPSFSRTGTLHATVDEDMFVYAVKDGKLVDSFKWNKTAKCWEMDTKVLEGVVISDTKLDIDAFNKTVGTTTDKTNPGTGSVDFVNVAVALGVVSLAAAGAVALKK